MSEDLTIMLVAGPTGQTESMPVAPTMTVAELTEFGKAVFGLTGGSFVLVKDGKALTQQQSLAAAGVKQGDMLAIQAVRPAGQRAAAGPAPAAPRLDFGNLLGQARPAAAAAAAAPPAGAGLDFSNLLATQQAPTAAGPPAPVYYPGMNLNEAMSYNPHPHTFISLLRSKEHLSKELNYHNPTLAAKLAKTSSLEAAVSLWREELVKGGIQNALKASTQYHEELEMQRRITQNPEDANAKAYFKKQECAKKVQEQFQQMMQEYPESLGRVLMLYIHVKINGHEIAAFCDSGAQATIMSHKVARDCQLDDYIDTKFAGMAVGVGTGKILGRIHVVQMQIGNYYFPCSVTVMEDPQPDAITGSTSGREMPFLLGLDMMKRHTCQIDLEQGCLKFRIAPGQYMQAPFLHEKDLTESQGGTMGFDAARANAQVMQELQRQEQEDDTKQSAEKNGDKKDNKMEE